MKKVFYTNAEKEKQMRQVDKQIQEKLREIPMDELNSKTKTTKMIMYSLLSLTFVLTITYFISTIFNSFHITKQLETIIGVSIFSIFTILFIIMGLFFDHKEKRKFVIIPSLLISIYLIFQLLVQNNILNLSTQSVVQNFYGKDITEVIEWAEKHSILVKQIYENSDNFEMYKIMGQDIEAGTLVKKIKKLTVIVSEGPSVDKETLIPDMINWDVDQVIDFVDENFLTNLTINFDFSDNIEKDLIFEQKNESDKMLRNSKIILKASLGKKEDLDSIAMKNLVGMDTFHAITWLGRNAINYTIEYGYSDKYDDGTVIKQSVSKGKIIDKERTKEVVITIARKTAITVPDFKNLSQSEIMTWATDNKLKVNFKEEFDDNIEEGKVISSSKIKGDTVEVGETINIILSKGQIRMIKFTNVDDFKQWADENEVIYHIDYQFSNSVKNGQLISSSHKENDIIRNTDTVSLVISQGSNTTIPDFIGKTKSEALELCNDNNLKCEFEYSSSSEDNDIVIKQSMKKGSSVPSNISITITLSSGN